MRNRKYALVTGASKGIGRAIAISLAKEGFDLFVHYNTDKLGAIETKKAILGEGRRAYLVSGNFSRLAEIDGIFERINKFTDTLDLVVNNASIDPGLLIEQYDMADIEKVMRVNLLAPISITKKSLPYLRNSDTPKVINIASRLGSEKVIDGAGPYATSKAGLIRFTLYCAREFRGHNLKANVVSPGFTDTAITRGLFPDQEVWDEAAEANPSKRVGDPQDTANMVAFLASEKANYINGEVIGVNGGSNLM